MATYDAASGPRAVTLGKLASSPMGPGVIIECECGRVADTEEATYLCECGRYYAVTAPTTGQERRWVLIEGWK